MQPSLPLWLQRLPPDVRRRLEIAQATAVEARTETHAQQALNLVTVLSARVAFDAAVERYIEIMGLSKEEAENVHTRALVVLSETDMRTDIARGPVTRGWGLSWRYASPLGAVRFVRRHLRRNAEEDLWMELSAARAEEAIIRTHIRSALAFVEVLKEHVPPTRSVSLYLDQLGVPAARARSVYQRAMARMAEVELPRFEFRGDDDRAQFGVPPSRRLASED
jgi:hypothetical protein